jgi:thiamine pyrophosphokinase
MKGCIIIANGKAPKKSDVKYFQSLGYTTIICADGGANSVYKLGLIPNLIIGDFDSIDSSVLKYFSTRSNIIHYKRQNDTDVEKSLKYAIRSNHVKAVMLGATGDRLDHSICNLGILLKFNDHIRISMMHESSYMEVLSGKNVLDTIKGETISIYGFDKKTKIRSAGLKYPLNNIALPFGVRESTSNIAQKNIIELNITGGKVFVVRDYKLLKSHGLIS